MSFAKKLKEYREAMNLTQAELAEKAELAQVHISRYESGERLPNIATARRIADVLGVTVDSLSEEWGKEMKS